MTQPFPNNQKTKEKIPWGVLSWIGFIFLGAISTISLMVVISLNHLPVVVKSTLKLAPSIDTTINSKKYPNP